MTDDILEEVRRARLAYGERFGFDLEAIGRDLRERERLSRREVVNFPPRRDGHAGDVPVTDEAEAEPGSSQAPAVVRGS
jgi:hypothetical protein